MVNLSGRINLQGCRERLQRRSPGTIGKCSWISGDLIHVMESEITLEGFAALVVARDADALEDATKSFRKSR